MKFGQATRGDELVDTRTGPGSILEVVKTRTGVSIEPSTKCNSFQRTTGHAPIADLHTIDMSTKRAHSITEPLLYEFVLSSSNTVFKRLK